MRDTVWPIADTDTQIKRCQNGSTWIRFPSRRTSDVPTSLSCKSRVLTLATPVNSLSPGPGRSNRGHGFLSNYGCPTTKPLEISPMTRLLSRILIRQTCHLNGVSRYWPAVYLGELTTHISGLDCKTPQLSHGAGLTRRGFWVDGAHS